MCVDMIKTLAYYSANTVYMYKWENINSICYNNCEILLSEYYINIMLNVLCQLVVALGKNRIFFSFEPKLDSVRRRWRPELSERTFWANPARQDR